MREVAIVSPVRTAVGNFGGGLKDISAAELGATVIKAVLERTGLDPNKIDEVILGHGYPSGEEPAIGRLCALKAGLPIEVPGYQLDRRCSSGLQSILNACMMVQTGNADVVLAGGVESMSRVEFYTTDMRGGSRLGIGHPARPPDAGSRHGFPRRAVWRHLGHDRDGGEFGRTTSVSPVKSRMPMPYAVISVRWRQWRAASLRRRSCPSWSRSVVVNPNSSRWTKGHVKTPPWRCWRSCAR